MDACFWHPSPILYRLHMLLAVLALAALTASSLPAVPCAGLIVWLAGWAGWRSWQQRQGVQAGYRYGLRYLPRQGWQLWQARSGWRAVRIMQGTLVTPQLVVLRYRLAGQYRTRSLAVSADMLPADSHRRLRVRLRLTPLQDQAAVPFPAPRAVALDNLE